VAYKVLVVDDEREVLQVVEGLLLSMGYEVFTANNSDKATRLFESKKPDLVISDVVMPGLSGPMLADKLRELNPKTKVLFMSGYDHSQVVQRYVVQQGFHLIAKPFNIIDLKSAVETSLQETIT
jgi:two-component system cell cycle sensor histidine kinase/response regulator CckA